MSDRTTSHPLVCAQVLGLEALRVGHVFVAIIVAFSMIRPAGRRKGTDSRAAFVALIISVFNACSRPSPGVRTAPRAVSRRMAISSYA